MALMSKAHSLLLPLSALLAAHAAAQRVVNGGRAPPQLAMSGLLKDDLAHFLNKEAAELRCRNASSNYLLHVCLTSATDNEYDSGVSPIGASDPVGLVDTIMVIERSELLEIDEKSQRVLIRLDVSLFWHDHRLAYNASTFAPTTVFGERPVASAQRDELIDSVVSDFATFKPEPDDIWTPQLAIMQSTFAVPRDAQRSLRAARVRPSGLVQLSDGIVDWFSCAFDNNKFPVDESDCRLSIEVRDVRVHVHAPADVGLHDTVPNSMQWSGDWKVVNKRVSDRRVLPYPLRVSFLQYEIFLNRQSNFQTFLWAILPVVLQLATSWCLFFGCDASERYQFAGSSMIALFLLAAALGEKLPVTGDHVPPIIQLYVSLAFGLFAALLLASLPDHARNFLKSYDVTVTRALIYGTRLEKLAFACSTLATIYIVTGAASVIVGHSIV